CVMTAALLDGHARVGFENNEMLPDGRRAASNAELVRATRDALRAVGMDAGDADMLRRAGARVLAGQARSPPAARQPPRCAGRTARRVAAHGQVPGRV